MNNNEHRERLFAGAALLLLWCLPSCDHARISMSSGGAGGRVLIGGTGGGGGVTVDAAGGNTGGSLAGSAGGSSGTSVGGGSPTGGGGGVTVDAAGGNTGGSFAGSAGGSSGTSVRGGSPAVGGSPAGGGSVSPTGTGGVGRGGGGGGSPTGGVGGMGEVLNHPLNYPLIIGDKTCPAASPKAAACTVDGASCVYSGIRVGVAESRSPMACACARGRWSCVSSDDKGDIVCPLEMPTPVAGPCPPKSALPCSYAVFEGPAVAACFCQETAAPQGGAGGGGGVVSTWSCGL